MHEDCAFILFHFKFKQTYGREKFSFRQLLLNFPQTFSCSTNVVSPSLSLCLSSTVLKLRSLHLKCYISMLDIHLSKGNSCILH